MEGFPCCRMCHFIGSDLRLIGCGCTLHARCLPVSLVVSMETTKSGQIKSQTTAQSNTKICPFCKTRPVGGIQLFPMTVELLDRAAAVRKAIAANSPGCYAAESPSFSLSNKAVADVKAEASYLFAASGSTSLSMSSLNQRTGRWTDEETDFVDFLVHAFDDGSLPMAAGVRLNDFLCSVLMCKASRLTKKMKNARLSMRLYEFKENAVPLDCEMMTTMQEKFLHSIEDEYTRLELRFIMDKAWRQNISNLCLQVGYATFDASAWVASLDVMEKRATKAEEKIRKARRARMGLAMRTGMDIEPLSYEPGHSSQHNDAQYHHNIATETRKCSESLTSPADEGGLSRSTSLDDFTNIFNHLQRESINSINYRKAAMLRNSSGSFLDEVLLYIQAHNLPFEHVDAWVLSNSSAQGEKAGTTGEKPPHLLQGGHATRCDVDPELFRQFHEYGDMISNFSYLPGAGLPGRVFESGKPAWECGQEISDPNAFGCAHVAKSYGIKTRVGIPLSAHADGRIVIVLYSIFALVEDKCKAETWMSDLASLCPRPKWRLVVESCRLAPASTFSRYPASQQSPFNPLNNKDSADKLGCISDSIPSQTSVSTGDMTSQENSSCERNECFSSLPSTSTQDHTDAFRSKETAIATLLADHMPDIDLTRAAKISMPSLVPHCFMSLRLLLLRVPDHRSPEENKLIEMIRERYDDYSDRKNYSQAEIAKKLVKDWSSMTLTRSRTKRITSTSTKNNSLSFSSPNHPDSLVSLIKSTCGCIPSNAPGTQTEAHKLNGNLDANVRKRRRLLDDLEDAINIVDDDEVHCHNESASTLKDSLCNQDHEVWSEAAWQARFRN